MLAVKKIDSSQSSQVIEGQVRIVKVLPVYPKFDFFSAFNLWDILTGIAMYHKFINLRPFL